MDTYELGDNEKKCKKGFSRIPKTKKCRRRPVMNANKRTYMSSPSVDKYEIGEQEKRCKKGYSRIPNTKTCIKKVYSKMIKKTDSIKRTTPVKYDSKEYGHIYDLGQGKRCKKGYKRIPKTNKCKKKESILNIIKTPIKVRTPVLETPKTPKTSRNKKSKKQQSPKRSTLKKKTPLIIKQQCIGVL